MTLQELKEQIKAETARARGLKTKKAQHKAWDRVRDLDREARHLLHEECRNLGPQSLRGTVKRFSARDEHYLVDTPYGSMWLSPTNDELSKSWYAHTCCIEYVEGQTVVVEITFEVNSDTLSINVVPGRVYGGTVNEEQYAELDKRTDLAFFKHSGADGVTGLFSQAKAGGAR